ncbi:acylphosphatase [Marinitoga sp. 1197]|uniref:acylphosphatase n=1 Tax=unclassified Marinitoga TaxID=2640159 RepID=UPI0006415F2A|nr:MULTISPECIES: acylphosphatase [unclassified Marinitoga]KLO21822.1 acylphosphatase [Marinitoga sp. 1197]KLO22920.1 acylphosphatase [Marinitoga sp. 1155]NUV00354.1 acylphosphatase [Marinitoga sp. 1154]
MFAKKYRVYGRVQGVGFRWFINKIAKSLDINGYVMNMSDGSVEIWAEGNIENIENLKQYIIKGNGFSYVENIIEDNVSPKGYTYFSIKY